MFKSILLILLISAASLKSHSQCYKSSFASATMAFGQNKNGVSEYMESGVWDVDRSLSFFAGVSASNGNAQPKSTVVPLLVDAYGRLLVKLHRDPIYGFFNTVTIYASARGNVGATYRLYYQVSRNFMIGIEPGYSMKEKQCAYFLATVAFD